MSVAQWARTSNDAFNVALLGYVSAMVGYFYYLAFRRETVWRIASTVTWIALAAHVTSVVARGFAADRVPWGNLYEYSSMLALLMVAAYLVIVEWRYKVKSIGGFVLALAVLTMAVAVSFLYVGPAPLVPALNSYWIKTTSSLRSSARRCSHSGAGSSLGCTCTRSPGAQARRARRFWTAADRGRRDRSGRAGRRRIRAARPRRRRAGTLPALAARRVAPSRLHPRSPGVPNDRVRLPDLDVRVIAGAIWAQEAWGRYWGWDPKETWSFIVWVIYAGYLHARATAGWKVRARHDRAGGLRRPARQLLRGEHGRQRPA